MLSKHSFWCLNVVFKTSKYFANPFEWNKSSRIVTISKNNLFAWKCIASILFAYGFFAFGRLLQSIIWYNLPLYNCITQIYFSISSFYFGIIALACWLNYEEFAIFWTKFLQFDRKYSHENFNGTQVEKVGILCKLLVVLSYCHMIFQGVGFIFIRKSPNFIYSLIWEYWEIDNIWLIVIFAVFEMLVMFYSWGCCTVINAGIILLPSSVRIWNEYIATHGRQAWRQNKILYYKCLQILMADFSSAYSPVAILGQEFAVFLGGIICLYATISFYSKVHILIYLTMPISLILMLSYEKIFHSSSSSVYTSSKKLLKSYELDLWTDVQLKQKWARTINKTIYFYITLSSANNGTRDQEPRNQINEINARIQTWLQIKYHKSLRPTGIPVSSIYLVQPCTILTFGSLIFQNAINMLLAK